MPLYEYECQSCGERFERLFLSISQVPDKIQCPVCHSADVRRLLSAPAVHVAGGDGGDVGAEEESPPPTTPPLFGRKELNEVLKSRER